jgi:hypothetical protein
MLGAHLGHDTQVKKLNHDKMCAHMCDDIEFSAGSPATGLPPQPDVMW